MYSATASGTRKRTLRPRQARSRTAVAEMGGRPLDVVMPRAPEGAPFPGPVAGAVDHGDLHERQQPLRLAPDVISGQVSDPTTRTKESRGRSRRRKETVSTV
jgi:hypothetical protein